MQLTVLYLQLAVLYMQLTVLYMQFQVDCGAGCYLNLFRGGLVFEAHRLLYHSTLGLRVIKKKKRTCSSFMTIWRTMSPEFSRTADYDPFITIQLASRN